MVFYFHILFQDTFCCMFFLWAWMKFYSRYVLISHNLKQCRFIPVFYSNFACTYYLSIIYIFRFFFFNIIIIIVVFLFKFFSAREIANTLVFVCRWFHEASVFRWKVIFAFSVSKLVLASCKLKHAIARNFFTNFFVYAFYFCRASRTSTNGASRRYYIYYTF